MSINTVTMSGRLTTAPKISATAKGTQVVEVSIAVSEYVNSEERTSFFNWVGFGDRWVKVANYLDKGSLVTLNGKAKQDTWERDGKKQQKVSFLLYDIQLPTKKTNEEYYGDKTRSDTRSGQQSILEVAAIPQASVYDDDIQF